jgi:exodeoxyribonuclease VIII
MWWMGQGDEARSALSKDTVPIAMALNEFYEWVAVCSSIQTVRVWGNGASFDNVILSSAYRSCRIAQPWQFWNDRCYRTVKAMHPAIKMQRTGIHHNAVDDAVSQTRHLLEMLKP